MKTIFFLLPLGLTARNVIATGVLDKLVARPDTRVIAFTLLLDEIANYKKDHSRLTFVRFPQQPRMGFSRFVHRALRARFERINENHALRCLAMSQYLMNPRETLVDKFLRQPFPKSSRIYQWLRILGQYHPGDTGEVKSLFDRYRPSLVVATNPTRMDEYPFLRVARRRGIRTVGMIKSWDILSKKGYLPEPADYYLVWTEIMKGELMRLHGVAAESIGVTGTPQFDIYAEPIPPSRREEFLKQLGLDPRKKTILYGTSVPRVQASDDVAILDGLLKRFNTMTLAENIQVIARLHPMDDLARYRNVSYPNLVYQVPGRPFENRIDARYLDPDYLYQLRDSLAFSDLVINTASTLTLEAAIFDKPVINLALDMEPTDYWRSPRQFYDHDHYQPVVRSGAVKIAGTMDELVQNIIRYLENPRLEREERASLCETMFCKLDGRSAQRVANYLVAALEGCPFPTDA